jgi:hypothetical protein
MPPGLGFKQTYPALSSPNGTIRPCTESTLRNVVLSVLSGPEIHQFTDCQLLSPNHASTDEGRYHNALVVDSETLQSPARYSNGKKMSIPTLEEQAQRSWL